MPSDLLYACFYCHQPGHVKANCPKRTPIANTPPGAPPEGAPEQREEQRVCLTCGAKGTHTRTCGQPPSEPERFAAILDSFGFDRTGLVRTEFREKAGLLPRTEAQLRAIAARQVAAARSDRKGIES